jgi:signal peptidase
VALVWPAQFGGITGLTVVDGHSMEPLYHTGDLVISVRQPAYAVGDVVSYQVPEGQPGAGGRVIHRIVAVDNGVYSTLGDNNPDLDPWRFESGDVLGKAVFMIPSIGAIGTVLGSQAGLIAGLACGLLVTILLWRSGGSSSAERGKHRG